MTAAPLLVGMDTLTCEQVAAAARRPRWQIALPPAARARMTASAAARRALVESGQPIYGVTTGFGDSNTRQISPARTDQLQRHLIQYHLVGSGTIATPEVARATMLIRANCLARGYSGVRPALIELILGCLRHDVLPVIPERGSVGASGDLVPLCYLADMLTGSGSAQVEGSVQPAAAALAGCGLEPVRLEAKEGLALINGTSFMAAFATLAVVDAANVAAVADVCTAMATEVLLGNRGHFAAEIHEQKPHPGQLRSAARVSHLLADSRLARDHAQVLAANPALGGLPVQRLTAPIQERYSVRCAPHVTGVLLDTLEWARRWLDIEINSTNDNPIFDPVTGAVHNGGNFYGGHVGQAMDALKVALAMIADLLDRQLALIVDERYSNGLPANLTATENSVAENGAAENGAARHGDADPGAGLHHGFKGAQIACSALTAEALKMASPATVFSRSTESHNQDKVSMGTIAARDARTIVDLVIEVAALHLAALCQAADLRGVDRLAPGTRRAYELVRQHMPFVDRDRRMDGELAALAAVIRSGELRATVFGGTVFGADDST